MSDNPSNLRERLATAKLEAAGARLDAAMVRVIDNRTARAQGRGAELPRDETFMAYVALAEAANEMVRVARESDDSLAAATEPTPEA